MHQKNVGIAVHMPKFYSDNVLVSLGWIAIGIAIAHPLDAITDPMMGWLSDRTNTTGANSAAEPLPPAATMLRKAAGAEDP